MTDSETLAQWNLRGITFRQAVREGTHAPDGPRQGTLGPQHTEPGGLDHPTWKLPFKYAMVVPPFIGAEVTTGGAITEYPLPTAGSFPYGIASGPDGNLWFTELTGNNIGQITIEGAITEYPLTAGAPYGIASGPDGNLWFTEWYGNNIGRITIGGAITEYPIPTAGSYPVGIASGPDGNLWFTEYFGNNIGRITIRGAITEYPTPTARSWPWGITGGPDKRVWFTESAYDGNNIGALRPSAASPRT